MQMVLLWDKRWHKWEILPVVYLSLQCLHLRQQGKRWKNHKENPKDERPKLCCGVTLVEMWGQCQRKEERKKGRKKKMYAFHSLSFFHSCHLLLASCWQYARSFLCCSSLFFRLCSIFFAKDLWLCLLLTPRETKRTSRGATSHSRRFWERKSFISSYEVSPVAAPLFVFRPICNVIFDIICKLCANAIIFHLWSIQKMVNKNQVFHHFGLIFLFKASLKNLNKARMWRTIRLHFSECPCSPPVDEKAHLTSRLASFQHNCLVVMFNTRVVHTVLLTWFWNKEKKEEVEIEVEEEKEINPQKKN